MPDHPISRDPRLLNQMLYQIYAVKPRLVVATVWINADLDVDRVFVIDSSHQRRSVLLAYSPCSVRVVECLIDRCIINVIMDRCSQIAIIMRPGVGSCSGPFVEIISLMDYDVLWVILACIAINLFDLFCNCLLYTSPSPRDRG